MFTSLGLAQAKVGGFGDIVSTILPLVLIMAVFWFLLIRPQQQRAKQHAAMIAAVRRGDTIVTSGGIVGKVTRVVDDHEVMAEIADGVRVKVVRTSIADVRAKTEPAKTDK